MTFGNCCYKLFGHSLKPCLRLLELSMTSRHQINSNTLSVWSVSTGKHTKSEVSHRITKSPHASLFKGGPGKKKQTDSRWWEKHTAFCYLPPPAAYWETSLHCGLYFLGDNLTCRTRREKLYMQAMFSDSALLVWVHLYHLPSRTQKWLKIIERQGRKEGS